MRIRQSFLAAFVASSAIAVAAADAQPTSPAIPTRPSTSTTPADAISLDAKISSVKGTVQVRAADNEPWVEAKVGMRLTQGSELRTGLRSAVQFIIEPDQLITLDRLGTVKVLQAYLSRGKAKVDLGMKYGRTEYDIQATDLEHESTIRSPGSTLAIRGTQVIYEDQAPWTPNAVSLTGQARFRNDRREMLAFGGRQPAAVSANKSSAAQVAAQKSTIDPKSKFAGRTDNENDLLLTVTSGGGVDAQGLQAIQSLARIGGFKGSFIGVPPVPGPLGFELDWFSTAANPGAANLDLLVTDPKGRTASFTNPLIGTGSAQGQHLGDDSGSTGAGAENVVWGLFFLPGKYKVQAIHRGGDAAQVFVIVTQGQDAQAIKTFGIDPDPAITLQPGEQFNATVNVKKTPSASPNARTGSPSPRTASAAPKTGRGK
jgi:hypothetical protein